MLRTWQAVLLALGVGASGAQAAQEVAGVKFEDKASLGGKELTLNGAGVRTRFVVKVYAMGLYVAEKKGAAADLVSAPGAKRAHIVLLRDLGAQQFVDALNEGLRKNHGEAELAQLKPQIDEFTQNMLSLKEAKKGDVILIDYLPESGTRLTAAGQPRGKDIVGEELYRALLRVWLGDKPADDDLKTGLLGQGAR